MTAAFGAGALAGLAVALPVGAVSLVIVTLAARYGWRVGAAAGLGAATVDGVYAVVALTAGRLAAPALRSAATPLHWTAAAVLAAVAVLLARPAWRPGPPVAGPSPDAPTRRPLGAYLTVVGLTAVNPLTVVYFAALVAGASFGRISGPADSSAVAAGVLCGSAVCQLAIASVGAALGRALTGDRGRRGTAVLAGVLVLLLAVRTALG